MRGVVFHGSVVSDLDELQPRFSSHGKRYLYAAHSSLIATFFIAHPLRNFGDLSLGLGRNEITGRPYLCERYRGALVDSFDSVSGSLYLLPTETFGRGTSWPEEVVSSKPVRKLKEIKLNNVWAFLLAKKAKGAIEIYSYPDKPPVYPPSDDRDLVAKAVPMILNGGPAVWRTIKTYHPHLCARIGARFEQEKLYAKIPVAWGARFSERALAFHLCHFTEESNPKRAPSPAMETRKPYDASLVLG